MGRATLLVLLSFCYFPAWADSPHNLPAPNGVPEVGEGAAHPSRPLIQAIQNRPEALSGENAPSFVEPLVKALQSRAVFACQTDGVANYHLLARQQLLDHPQLLRSYRETYDHPQTSTAEQELRAALADGKLQGILRVAREYRLTQTGLRALEYAIVGLMDRGLFAEALIFVKIYDQDAPGGLSGAATDPVLRLRAYTTARHTGDTDLAQRLAKSLPEAQLGYGPAIPTQPVGESFEERLEQIVSGEKAADGKELPLRPELSELRIAALLNGVAMGVVPYKTPPAGLCGVLSLASGLAGGTVGTDTTETVSRWVKAIQATEGRLRQAGLDRLAQFLVARPDARLNSIPSDIVEAMGPELIRQVLDRPLPPTADPAGLLSYLVQEDPALAPQLKQGLTHLDPVVRAATLKILAQRNLIAGTAPEILDPLLKEPDPRVRRDTLAAMAVGSAFGNLALQSRAETIIAQLSHPHPEVVLQALELLPRLKEKGQATLPALIPLLGKTQPSVQNGILRAVERMNAHSPELLSSLGPLLGDAEVGPRAVRTAGALWHLDAPGVQKILAQALSYPALYDDVMNAARANRIMLSPILAEAMKAAKGQPDPKQAFLQLGRALSSRGDTKESVRILAGQLKAEDATERRQALHTLQGLGQQATGAESQMVALLEESPSLRADALHALRELKSNNAATIAAIEKVLAQGSDEESLVAAAQALYRLQGPAALKTLNARAEQSFSSPELKAGYLRGLSALKDGLEPHQRMIPPRPPR